MSDKGRATKLNLWGWIVLVVGLTATFENLIAGIILCGFSIMLSLLARSDDKETSPAALILASIIITIAFLVGSFSA